MSASSPPLFATWLGYLTALLAAGAVALVLAAIWSRREDLEKWGAHLVLATAVAIIPTTLTALAVHVLSWASDNVYAQLFLAASLFTLAATLVDWRSRDAEVLWKPESRILYLGGYLGCLALALATIWMG